MSYRIYWAQILLISKIIERLLGRIEIWFIRVFRWQQSIVDSELLEILWVVGSHHLEPLLRDRHRRISYLYCVWNYLPDALGAFIQRVVLDSALPNRIHFKKLLLSWGVLVLVSNLRLFLQLLFVNRYSFVPVQNFLQCLWLRIEFL